MNAPEPFLNGRLGHQSKHCLYPTLAALIGTARHRSRLSIPQVTRRLPMKLSKDACEKNMRGQVQDPKPEIFQAIAKALNLDYEKIVIAYAKDRFGVDLIPAKGARPASSQHFVFTGKNITVTVETAKE